MERPELDDNQHSQDSANPLCPLCGSVRMRISTTVDVEYEVTHRSATQDYRVVSDIIGDSEWTPESPVRCTDCSWRGTVSQLCSATASRSAG